MVAWHSDWSIVLPRKHARDVSNQMVPTSIPLSCYSWLNPNETGLFGQLIFWNVFSSLKIFILNSPTNSSVCPPVYAIISLGKFFLLTRFFVPCTLQIMLLSLWKESSFIHLLCPFLRFQTIGFDALTNYLARRAPGLEPTRNLPLNKHDYEDCV